MYQVDLLQYLKQEGKVEDGDDFECLGREREREAGGMEERKRGGVWHKLAFNAPRWYKSS